MNKQRNIVIVDDEKDILDLLKINIERKNYRAHCFQDGESAISYILKNKPDLIILDVWLDGSKNDGLELLRIFKKLNPHIPIIMISHIHNRVFIRSRSKIY